MNAKICIYKAINNKFRNMGSILFSFCLHQDQHGKQPALKKTKVKLVLLTDFDVLLMVDKGNRGGICYAIHRYAGTKKKYIKIYGKNKESLYVNY